MRTKEKPRDGFVGARRGEVRSYVNVNTPEKPGSVIIAQSVAGVTAAEKCPAGTGWPSGARVWGK